MIDFVPLATIAPTNVEALLDAAFGPDRHRRTAYAVRGAGRAIDALSIAAIDDGMLIGSIQCWPVALREDGGREHPLIMLGPVAVAPDRQREGIGRMLMTRALLTAHDESLDGAMMLIGDPDYYERFFGFTAAATGRWRLPGPVEAHRLLAKGADVPDLAGMLGPRAG